MKNRQYIGLLLLILLASCEKEPVNFYIDPELQPYFDLFSEEASARGLTVDFEAASIETEFTDLEGNVPGQCAHSEASPNLLRIDPTIWNSYEEWEKEFLIFHELGHCYLGRSHDDAKDEAGNCKSIMHSSSSVCTNTFNSDRILLLDELFN